MTSLQGVWLNSNSFSGTLPPEYQAWSRLEWFYLWGNPRISGTLPESWGKGMHELTELQLGGLSDLCLGLGEGSLMTGTLPPAWSGLVRLKTLNVLCMPNLSGSLPPEWGALEELEVSHMLLLTASLINYVAHLAPCTHAILYPPCLHTTCVIRGSTSTQLGQRAFASQDCT
jgi:hypothetical protein